MNDTNTTGPVILNNRTVGHVRRYGNGYEGILDGLLSGRVIKRSSDADMVRNAVIAEATTTF